MFIRSLFFFLTVLFALYLYISALNPTEVRFQFYPEAFIDTSLSILVMSSFFLGGLLVALLYAVRDLKRAVGEKGQRKREREVWERLHRAAEAALRGRFSEAERHLRKALKLAPTRPILHLKLAEVYEAQGRWDKALEVLQGAKGLEEAELEVLAMEARVLMRAGRQEEAARVLEELLGLDPQNLEGLKALRDLKMQRGEWPQAVELQERLLKLSPEDDGELLLGMRYERAKMWARGEDHREALKELKRLAKEAPSFVPSQVLWGDLLVRKGKEKAALRVWQRAWEGTRDPIFLERLEEAYLSRGDPRGIVHIYLEALTEASDQPVLALFYARLCLRLGMLDEALSKLEEQETSLAHHPAFYYLKAEIHMQREEEREALECYRKGLELEGKDLIPYRCKACGHQERRWLDRCPSCGRWGTFKVCTLRREEPTTTEVPMEA